jgi:hypothetical protein
MCFTRVLARPPFLCRQSAEIVERSKLKLLDGTLGLSKRLRDLPDTSFFGETHLNYPALNGGETIHHAK